MTRRAIVPVLRFLGSLLIALATARMTSAQSDGAEGFTEPYRRVDLAAAEPGLIAQLTVRPGDRVEAGQVLGSLDTSVLEASLALAQARRATVGALQAADAERRVRKQHWHKLRELFGRGHATQRELDRAEADYRIAEARYTMAVEEQKLQTLDMRRIEAQIDRRRFRSPIRGVVADVYHEEGEAILANDPRVTTIVQLDRLKVKYALLPSRCETLHTGQDVRVYFPEKDQAATGTIETISPVIDAKSGTVEITVVIDNPEAQLASGARCLLEFDSAGVRKKTRYTSASGH